MGYTRMVEFADTVIVYKYSREYVYKERYQSQIQKKRAKEMRKLAVRTRSKQSIHRSRQRFFRLCHHNNYIAKTVTFATFTFAYDVTYQEATRALSEFFRRLQKKLVTEVPISYISVPERTQAGRIHFHLLIYNIPTSAVENERITRNFQRQWQRGYVDMRNASYIAEGISGYMAKYMAKGFENFKHAGFRGYTCSRNIDIPRNEGGNAISFYVDMSLSTGGYVPVNNYEYDTQYMGQCSMVVYKKSN